MNITAKTIILLGIENNDVEFFADQICNELWMLTAKSSHIAYWPEAYLHPSKHCFIIEKYIKNNKQVIIATHSELICLRLRRMIAEKLLKPENVQMFWVESKEKIQEIKIYENGELDFWPEGIFNESFEEICAIRQAQNNEIV